MAKTAKRIEARERARLARVRLDADRARRDESIELAAAAFFTGADLERELHEQLDAVRAEQDQAIRALLDLGESQKRVADLLEVDVSRVRQARTVPAAAQIETAQPSDAEGEQHD